MNTEINGWLDKIVNVLAGLKVQDNDPRDECDWR